MDRSIAGTQATAGGCPGHGQLRQRDLRRAGGHSLQWAFWLHLLSPALLLQPVWRRRTLHAQGGERTQRQGLEECLGTGRGTLPWPEAPPSFSSRRRIRSTGALPVSGGRRIFLCHSAPRERRIAAGDRAPLDAARGPTLKCTAGPVCRLFLPGPELEPLQAGGRQG